MRKTRIDKQLHRMPAISASIALLFALAPWPYGYYQLLRFVVCAVSVYVSFTAYAGQTIWATYMFVLIAVLFNPLIPIHLSRVLWQPIDAICALLFIIAAIAIKKPIQKSSD